MVDKTLKVDVEVVESSTIEMAPEASICSFSPSLPSFSTPFPTIIAHIED